ncbi:hypothetical protein [Burkholderia pseudomallei]|uniref:hypothetical protein n=1 Tax=Burkholderia pseudomallei TaxID=28450 RepID=UPI001AD7086C|nr:hypothetical protein [Burkholderia pseudomallei]
MNPITQVQRFPNADPAVGASARHVFLLYKPILSQMLVIAGAMLPTAASVGIATYAGWHRGGSLVERTMNIALGTVAVLYVHLLPMGCRALRGYARISAGALWSVSLAVVLYGQVSFFMVSQQHAGELRAETVSVAIPLRVGMPSGRSLTEIAQDAAKVRADLADAETRRCISDCPGLKVRRTTLAAKLAALDTEADEAKRREAEEDRRNELVDRNEELRATLRADPVAFQVASMLGTTEGRFELGLGVACAVVLEGAGVIGWLLVWVASGHAGSREAIASGRDVSAPDRPVVAPERDFTTGDRTTQMGDHEGVALGRAALSTEESADSPVGSEDELLLKKIHQAVVTGQLRPTQESIRKFLRCGQPKAGSLNRRYVARFGNTRN